MKAGEIERKKKYKIEGRRGYFVARGEVFDDWITTSVSYSIGGYIHSDCRCRRKCGNTKTIRTSLLISGTRRKCWECNPKKRRKRIRITKPDKSTVDYASVKEAAKAEFRSESYIRLRVLGYRKDSNGTKWEYLD